MDSVLDLIISIWFTVINTLSDFEVSFVGITFSLLDFCIAIIILHVLFRILFILPSRDDTLRAGKAVSERIRKDD